MHRKNVLVLLSVLPGLPFVWFGINVALKIVQQPNTAWYALLAPPVIATILGIAGSVGLIMAYLSVGSKKLVTGLICCGYFGIAAWATGAYASYPYGHSRYPVQLFIVLLILAWPVCAGVVAIYDQWSDHA